MFDVFFWDDVNFGDLLKLFSEIRFPQLRRAPKIPRWISFKWKSDRQMSKRTLIYVDFFYRTMPQIPKVYINFTTLVFQMPPEVWSSG